MDRKLLIMAIWVSVILFLLGGITLTGRITDSGELRVVISPNNASQNETVTVDSSSGRGGSYLVCDAEWRCYEEGICNSYIESLNNGEINVSFFNIIESKCLQEGIDLNSCGYKIWGCFDLNECGDNSTRPEPWGVCIFRGDEKKVVLEFPYIGFLEGEKYGYVSLILFVLLIILIFLIIYLSLSVIRKLYKLKASLEKIQGLKNRKIVK